MDVLQVPARGGGGCRKGQVLNYLDLYRCPPFDNPLFVKPDLATRGVVNQPTFCFPFAIIGSRPEQLVLTSGAGFTRWPYGAGKGGLFRASVDRAFPPFFLAPSDA